MYGHIYITHNGFTAVYKTTDYYLIYYALINMGYDHDSSENIASWAEVAALGEEYYTGDLDEIHIGE